MEFVVIDFGDFMEYLTTSILVNGDWLTLNNDIVIIVNRDSDYGNWHDC